jgi:hypothetical protein
MRLLKILLIGNLVFLLNANAKEFPFDITKIKGYHKGINLKTIMAPILNQIWIYSSTLPQKKLKKLILSKLNAKVIGYDEIYGLLVEFDNKNTKQLKIIEKIKLLNQIDNVFNRVYTGRRAFNE